MEIRDKVAQYVENRIETLRNQNPQQYNNISVIKTNVMKHITHYFYKGQVIKGLLLFI